MSALGVEDGAEQIELAEIPWSISEEIASWRRILHLTQGDPRSNFEQACAELMALSRMHPNDSEVRIAIVDALFDMSRSSGMADDEAQAVISAKSVPGAHRTAARTNGHAVGFPIEPEPPEIVPRFAPVAIDDVQVPHGPACLIEGILPIRGLAVFVGEPKAGKSNLVADMGFAVARGTSYGCRATLGGPVFYLTREGVLGFRRRLVAMRRHHGAEGAGVPFYMLDDMPNIGGEKTDVDELLRDLDQFIADRALPPPRMIILDTLARCIGEGDENSARDMGRAVSRCEMIERHFGCLVGLVHHVGKDASRGARGSNAINAATDVLITIEKHEGHSSARVEQMKDGPEGTEWTFRLLPFNLGETSDGGAETTAEVTACVVELLNEPSSPKPRETKKPKPPKGVTGDLLIIIRRAIDEAGESNVSSANVPNNVRAISRANLQRYCSAMAWQDPDGKPDSFRVMLNKCRSALRAGNYIAFDRDWTWLT